MVEADVFGTDRVELLNGRVHFLTHNEPHLWAVSRILRALLPRVPSQEALVCQGTLRLDMYNWPDPDFLWLTCPIGTRFEDWPDPLLLIEVSDTTYRKDSGPKLRKYAQAGIADYWIENLKEKRVEVYRDPKNPTDKLADCHYASVTHYVKGQSIALLKRPEVVIPVDELLPESK
ncbi:MAG: Uma2 family endonuclease [Tepidisphaeraceae bacterium]